MPRRPDIPSEELAQRYQVESINERERALADEFIEKVQAVLGTFSSGKMSVTPDIQLSISAEIEDYFVVEIEAQIAVRGSAWFVPGVERVKFSSFIRGLSVEVGTEFRSPIPLAGLAEYTAGGFFERPVGTIGAAKLDSFEMLNAKLDGLATSNPLESGVVDISERRTRV